jgi:hypothetical protein
MTSREIQKLIWVVCRMEDTLLPMYQQAKIADLIVANKDTAKYFKRVASVRSQTHRLYDQLHLLQIEATKVHELER